MLKGISKRLSDLSAPALHRRALVGLLATGFLDYATGFQASLSALYLVPVGLVAWYGQARWAYLVALLAAAVEQWANDLAGQPPYHLGITLWNDLIVLIHFVAFASLLLRVRALLRRERQLSRMDFLTGLPNRLMLLERLQAELARAHREGSLLTVGYIDLDHFKTVNDRFGHAEGDRLLRLVSEAMRSCLRRQDLLARLGGDEFAFIAVNCHDSGAGRVADKLLRAISELSAAHGWPVTGSVGLVEIGHLRSVPTPEEVLDLADALMYEAKTSQRSAVRAGVWRENHPTSAMAQVEREPVAL